MNIKQRMKKMADKMKETAEQNSWRANKNQKARKAKT